MTELIISKAMKNNGGNTVAIAQANSINIAYLCFQFIHMKAVTAKELKLELEERSPKELRELCLRLSRFKKENKELLTYLLFDASDEELYIESVKKEIDIQFEEINKKSNYLIKKSIRKILRIIRKYIRYSQKKKTEVDLLIYFCRKLKKMSPSIHNNSSLLKIYTRQIDIIRKAISLLHEDLQFDYGSELGVLNN
jgi:predicted nucleotidyltransferase